MPGPTPSMEPTPTERRMKKLLEDCERSGLSMAEFSRRRRLPPHRLRWWKYEIQRRAKRRGSRGGQREAASLVQLPISPLDLPLASSAQDRITVELPGGFRVHCPRNCQAAELREVLEAVRSTC